MHCLDGQEKATRGGEPFLVAVFSFLVAVKSFSVQTSLPMGNIPLEMGTFVFFASCSYNTYLKKEL